jgi:hypothetical protein
MAKLALAAKTRALVLLAASFYLPSGLCDAPQVRSEWVSSQLMAFPALPLEGINYRALKFEYALDGRAEIDRLEERQESITCAGAPRLNTYLEVHYRGPKVLFRVTDTSRDKVLLLREQPADGTIHYGQGSCHPEPVQARFERERARFLAQLQDHTVAQVERELSDFMATDAALGYQPLRFPLFSIEASDPVFERINQSFYRARDALELHAEYGVTIEAEDMLRTVAKSWETELEALGDDPNLRAVRQALHRNLVAVYFFLHQFDPARRHDARALSLGMSPDASWQKRILAQERHYILSTKAADDPVLLANLYRLGQNALQEATLERVDMEELEKGSEAASRTY